ncbi:hypothetical protein SASPL_134128 [Salvia splendens]|uniref:Disease resistance protein RPM1 n=1 Tax=Salvia splendens TaxID=180675 RepID=A0A8X8X5J0_SALSN|nr:hypothetical protein SASPL_134128 [Salvia splendens]
MAAYSAVTVFRQTLEQLLDSDQFPPHVSKTQIVSLHENVCSLQSSLDKIPFAPKVKREKMKDLQNRIREAIYAAQDEVDYWIRGNSPHGSDENTMKKLEEDIKLVEKDAVEMERETRNDGDLFRESSPQPRFNFSSKDKIVGQEEDFKVVSERLESGEKARVVIPITGLPGIGKTALVRSIYDDIETRKQFNIRAWITVSQDVNYQEINLISISEKSSNGGIKVCWMHDILREMAEIEARKEKFFHCRKKYDQGLEEGTKFQRRVSVHKNLLMSLEDVYETTKTITSARTLLYVGPHHHHPLPFCLTFDLLRVLDAFTVYFVEFPDEFLQLVHLTYLSLTYNDEIPPEISLLQKLQVLMVQRKPKLIFVGVSFLPDEIWEMPELRHLWFTETDFPPLPSAPRGDIYMLFNLQTLASVNAAYFTDEILGNIPNLRKLAMWIEVPDKIGFNVAKLSKLEHFKLIVLKPIPGKGIEVEAENFFPRTLKRVTLSGTGLPWEYMEFLAKELKDLQVLKLKEVAFHGDEWCPDYEFKQLKYLLIEYLHFKTWEATYEIFPRLQRLIVRHCYELEEIPQDIGYVGALEMMELVDCSPQAVDSAEQIIDEQKNFGNNGFEGRIFSSWE